MGDSLGKAIGCLFALVIAFGIIALSSGGYITYKFFTKKVIESKTRITPQIKLTTDGYKVDTLFIYKSK